MKFRRVLVLAGASLSFGVMAAQPSVESIEDLLSITRAESMVDGMNASVEQLMRSAMAETTEREKLSPTQQRVLDQLPARFAQLMREESNWAVMKPEVVEIYRSVYTQEEVDGQLTFYRSPAGQATISKMPQVLQLSMAMGERQMRRLMPKLQAALKEATAEAKAAK